MRRLSLVGFCIVAWVATLAAAHAQGRPSLSLDGTWEFRSTPGNQGWDEKWYRPGVPFPMKLRVPGSWNAQGVGDRTNKLFHNAPGMGWYRRTFRAPQAWHGKRVWLFIGGGHRRTEAYVNGTPVGAQLDYPISHRIDITHALVPGPNQTVVLAVDSRRNAKIDPLMGSFDTVDFLYADWGGLFEGVRLESSGDVWIDDDVFVEPDPAGRRATAHLGISSALPHPTELTLDYTVRLWSSHPIGRPLASGSVTSINLPNDIDLPLPNAPLWSPDHPNLLALTLTLRRGTEIMDRSQVRFGQRRVEIRGRDFYLNGEKIFLRGYGDDWTFPNEIAGLSNVDAWKRYLRLRKSYGFIAVRHHSCMPPASYLEAADEVGMLIQPELPIAYLNFYQEATDSREAYPRTWEAYVVQMRNHPSVFAWCMGNELSDGLPITNELYRTAKLKDPSRPVIDTDGLFSKPNRNTLDYLSVQFAESTMPWGANRNKYRLDWNLDKPVIVHEMGNISVLPDPADIPKYTGAVRPFWLEEMATRIREQHLEERLPQMLAASRRLQASLLKLNMESARLSPDVRGYHQWLFRDYWAQSSGFVNQFDEARLVTPKEALQFNGPAALLWDHDRVSFRSGEDIPLNLVISDYRPAGGPELRPIRIKLNGRAVSLKWSSPIYDSTGPRLGVRGRYPTLAAAVTAPVVRAAAEVKLEVSAGSVRNSWPVWVFPAAESVSPQGVRLLRRLTPKLLDELEQGSTVLLVDPAPLFPTIQASFKPAWWHGDDNDHVYGNMILPHSAMAGFPAQGYGDLQMYGLMNNRPVVLLDDVPGHIEPIVWCLDLPWKMRRKAYLFETRVGRGRLLVSSFDFSAASRARDPAAADLYARLIRYAQSDRFRPTAELPVSWLRERLLAMRDLDLTGAVEGFSQVLETSEPAGNWYSYREDNVPLDPVRQTDGRQTLSWLTAPVPTDAAGRQTVTFVWTGGMGWVTQPGGGHFTLSIEAAPALDFPFAQQDSVWKSPDGSISLRYLVRRQVGVDSFGIFVLTVPAERLKPGRPARLTVTATAQNSRRWFGLNHYSDVVAEEAGGPDR